MHSKGGEGNPPTPPQGASVKYSGPNRSQTSGRNWDLLKCQTRGTLTQTGRGVRVSRATQIKNILVSGPNNFDYGENQPMKHSIAQSGELKATFSTGSSCDLWPVTQGSYGS